MAQLNFYLPCSDEQARQARQQLNDIAAGLGYIAKAGPSGSGGAAAMLVDIAAGRLEVQRVDRTVTIEMTAERLQAMDNHGKVLWWTPGDTHPYWDSLAHCADDRVVATVTDFLDEAGYSDFDGVDDDEIFSLDVTLLPSDQG